MSDIALQFLETCQPEAVEAFKQLHAQMERAGATKLLLSDGPDCDFELEVADTDGDVDSLDDEIEIIAEFADRWGAVCPPDDDQSEIDRTTR